MKLNAGRGNIGIIGPVGQAHQQTVPDQLLFNSLE